MQCILDREAGLPQLFRFATFYRQLSLALSAVESPPCRFRLISFFFSFVSAQRVTDPNPDSATTRLIARMFLQAARVNNTG